MSIHEKRTDRRGIERPAALRKHFADVPFPAQPGLDAWAAALADAQAEGWARAVVAVGVLGDFDKVLMQ